MSTSAGSMLSFLRFRTRRQSDARRPAGPASSHLVNQEPLGPGLGTLVHMPGHSAPTTTMAASWPSARCVPTEAMTSACWPEVPCVPSPTMLARTLPDASLLTPAATIPTVLVPVMRTPGTQLPGEAPTGAPRHQAPVEGVETTTLPSREDAPATTIHPRRAR